MKEIALGLIQHSSWPIVALLAILLLRKDLTTLLRRLRVFRAGSIEVDLTEQLHTQGFTKAQLTALSKLSVEDTDIFLLVSFTDHPSFRYATGVEPSLFKSSLQRLQEAGLLQITNPDDPGTNILHELTPSGRRFRSLLVSSSAALVRQAA